MTGAHQRYGKNYDLGLLELDTGDALGFRLGISRLGVGRLTSTAGAWTSLLDEFVTISAAEGLRVIDGAWLEPDLSSLVITTRDPGALATYDGSEIRLRYDGVSIFEGIVATSVLASEIDENNLEVFTVTLTCRGYEALRNGLGATGTATATWHAGGAAAPVIQWDAGTIAARAGDITDGEITPEDDRADTQLGDQLAAEPDVTGTQGELLADLAIRAGLLLDQTSGDGVSFRSYQGAALWALEDEHVVSGYGVAYDRETASALAVASKEDDTYVLAFRAGLGRNLAARAISMRAGNDAWAAATFAGTVPLQGQARPYLTGATVPRHDDLQLPDRLPIEARFRHDGHTYRGAVVALQHTISKQRWVMTMDCAPVHLITRVGDACPAPPAHLAGLVAGTSATLTWSLEDAGTVQSTPGTPTYFPLLTAAADVVDVGDDLQLYSAAGALKEETLFRVTSKSAPSGGVVQVAVSPSISASVVAGDLLRYADFGVYPFGGWTIWYQKQILSPSFDNRLIGPFSVGNVPQSVTVFTNSATITGLDAAATYRFSVYALDGIEGVHSAPSELLELVT